MSKPSKRRGITTHRADGTVYTQDRPRPLEPAPAALHDQMLDRVVADVEAEKRRQILTRPA
jgi:hypothetical protein